MVAFRTGPTATERVPTRQKTHGRHGREHWHNWRAPFKSKWCTRNS